MRDWLHDKLGKHVDVETFLKTARFVTQSGTPLTGNERYQANTFVWFHRDLRHEPDVPGDITVVYDDERIVVVDKPPFLATIPRGRHVLQSVIVKLRNRLDLPELAPAHRLDRVTSGLLVLTKERRWRAPYQMVFQEQHATKTYLAVATIPPENLTFPVTVKNHLRKERGIAQVQEDATAEPNAISHIDVEDVRGDYAVYRLVPVTGKTHQLRQHMSSLGLPIFGDPLYPEVKDVDVDDFSEPLQLLASHLHFRDPVDGSDRTFTSARTLPIPPQISGRADTGEDV